MCRVCDRWNSVRFTRMVTDITYGFKFQVKYLKKSHPSEFLDSETLYLSRKLTRSLTASMKEDKYKRFINKIF